MIEASSIPELTMAHFTSQYGDKKIVQEYLAAMIATLRQYAKSSTQLAIFQSFLTEVRVCSCCSCGNAPPQYTYIYKKIYIY